MQIIATPTESPPARRGGSRLLPVLLPPRDPLSTLPSKAVHPRPSKTSATASGWSAAVATTSVMTSAAVTMTSAAVATTSATSSAAAAATSDGTSIAVTADLGRGVPDFGEDLGGRGHGLGNNLGRRG